MQMMDFDFFSSPMILMFFMGGMGLLNILFAILVYNDAVNQNIPNASLWFVIVLVTSFLGAVIYLLFKPANRYSVTNSGGSSNLNGSNIKIFNKNTHSISRNIFCSSCGTKNVSDSKYCENCGEIIQ
ncbi:MAG: hypothetical protein HeimC3_20310 [Candidatus Heimdallarchaeota archaeon LC_3]|nr:MAG: hypothetical protein HeimC3_20310 [Candidatus Heimdallarchaeota archaeon LC_3]